MQRCVSRAPHTFLSPAGTVGSPCQAGPAQADGRDGVGVGNGRRRDAEMKDRAVLSESAPSGLWPWFRLLSCPLSPVHSRALTHCFTAPAKSAQKRPIHADRGELPTLRLQRLRLDAMLPVCCPIGRLPDGRAGGSSMTSDRKSTENGEGEAQDTREPAREGGTTVLAVRPEGSRSQSTVDGR